MLGITGYVTTGAGRIHVVTAGSGPLVVFCHGFPESWYSWRHQLPVLAAAGFRAVAIDVRGYGRSSKPLAVGDYGMMQHVADNVGVMEALGAETAVIVGHDWGGQLSWLIAAAHPERLISLNILSRPHPAACHRRS